jgi:hypothetical protein
VGTALRLSVPTLDSGGGPSICRACPYFRRLGRHVMICYGPLIELGMWSLLSNSHFGAGSGIDTFIGAAFLYRHMVRYRAVSSS